MPAIEVDHLRRIYRTTIGVRRRRAKEVPAVDDLTVEVVPSELFGPLGPNGAGKTTTVKILTTLLLPTSGTARGGIAAARLIINGAPLEQVSPLLVGEFLVGVVCAFLGYSLFRRFEMQAKRRGTLEAF
jgi:ABC-type branched-subunit amino acid transport system ATPase component